MTAIVETYCDATPHPLPVVIDMCEVRFLSCASVRVVLGLAEWGARAGVPVGMTVPDEAAGRPEGEQRLHPANAHSHRSAVRNTNKTAHERLTQR
jgi:hypothetical protein